jgi:hypothetical protein
MRSTLAAIGLSFLMIGPVWAEEQTSGSSLLMDCEGRLLSFCYGYLLGVWDGIAEDPELNGSSAVPARICPVGEPVTAEQLRLVFLKWAKTNPALLSLAQRRAAALSFMEAFRCTQ